MIQYRCDSCGLVSETSKLPQGWKIESFIYETTLFGPEHRNFELRCRACVEECAGPVMAPARPEAGGRRRVPAETIDPRQTTLF